MAPWTTTPPPGVRQAIEIQLVEVTWRDIAPMLSRSLIDRICDEGIGKDDDERLMQKKGHKLYARIFGATFRRQSTTSQQ